MVESLSLVRITLDSRVLTTFAAQQKLLDDDLGYALHLALRRSLGQSGPQPFRRMENTNPGDLPATITLLAYSRDIGGLNSVMGSKSLGSSENRDNSLLARLFVQPPESRPMPEDWSEITELDFEVLIRPVRRLGSKVRSARQQNGEASAGSERDAFLSAVEASEDDSVSLDRESIYVTWLAERLAPAAEIVDGRCYMEQFRRTRLRRSMHSKGRTRAVEGPEALMKGRLRITNTEAFDVLLSNGVGRHTAFGFGMLLLAPPRD